MSTVNICYATDENYAGLVAVSMISALENRDENSYINFYILENDLLISTQNKFQTICNRYSKSTIQFFSVKLFLEKLADNRVQAQGRYSSLSAYSRLFVSSLLPKNIEQILYLDADTLVETDLADLFIEPLEKAIGAVIDILPSFHKEYLNFSSTDKYYNSGVLLINLKYWRLHGIEDQILNHLDDGNNYYSFHDQDIINIIFKNNIHTLDPKYMCYFPEYQWGTKKILYLTDLMKETYYSANQLIVAKSRPSIIHLVDSIYGRPWYKYQNNPLYDKWVYYSEKSNIPIKIVDNKISIKNRILKKFYFLGSNYVFLKIYKIRKNKALLSRENKYKALRNQY